jgi:hypothetical protein
VVLLSELKKALSRLKLSESESRAALRRFKAKPLPEGWHVKLDQFKKETVV